MFGIIKLILYILMVTFLVIRHKIDSLRLAATNITLLLSWFVYQVLYILFLFTQNELLGKFTWFMSGSLHICFVALMFRLQYLLIMMEAPKVTPEKTEYEMRKMKLIRGSVVAAMIFMMPLDFESLAN